MKKRTLLILMLLLGCVLSTFAQERPRLGILPFTGGAGGDGEAIATLFSFQPEIQRAFVVVPRTGAVDALVAEQAFQLAGFTDSDTIAGIGRMLNADFVLSGHIRQLGGRSLVIATIINVETFEQIAGDFRTYHAIEEVRELLPAMAERLIASLGRDTSALPALAIAPFSGGAAGVNIHEAETLAQILAVEISNTGRYAVLPRRTSAIQAAMQELEFQRTGRTTEEGVIAVGRAINADYVLAAEAQRLGGDTMFTAQILHVEDGSIHAGGYRLYRAVEDGVRLMRELALLLTDDREALQALLSDRTRQQEARAEARRQQQEARAEERRQQQEVRAEARRQQTETRRIRASARGRDFNFWLGTGGVWGQAPETHDSEDDESTGSGRVGGADLSFGGSHFFPTSFLTLGFEFRATPINEMLGWQVGVAPTFGLEFPVGARNQIRIFTNVFIEGGYYGHWQGVLTDWATFGFDVGIRSDVFGIRYRNIIFNDVFLHSVSLILGQRALRMLFVN